MTQVLVLAVALAFDLLLGEYPSRLHPVVWMGRLADRLLELAPRRGTFRQLAFGSFLVLGVTLPFAAPSWLLLQALAWQGEPIFVLGAALLLKPAFALRALWAEVEGVRARLLGSDLAAARGQVWRIVSRDVAVLSPGLIASAAIESASESLTDSFVAPLFYFALLGPAGALAYRGVNTLDAMIGYHGRFEYLGKAAARLDDVLNFVPARLAAALLAVSAGPAGGSVGGALRVLWRDHRRTESPNAGWTMSAMAGALGVRLEKPGTYVLNEHGEEPGPANVRRGLLTVMLAALLWVLVLALFLVWREGGGPAPALR